MKLCYVTDRKALPGEADAQLRLLLGKVESAARAGVDWIQIREKDLTARELLLLVQEARRSVAGRCRILVNDRLDVALAGSADGVHLGEHSLPVPEVRRLIADRKPEGQFLVGASTHSVESVQHAGAAGADYVIFGPVFATPSKFAYGAPQGLQRLAELCRSVSIPVIAIGGVTIENARKCLQVGAAGLAAIRLFQEARDVAETVQALRKS